MTYSYIYTHIIVHNYPSNKHGRKWSMFYASESLPKTSALKVEQRRSGGLYSTMHNQRRGYGFIGTQNDQFLRKTRLSVGNRSS